MSYETMEFKTKGLNYIYQKTKEYQEQKIDIIGGEGVISLFVKENHCIAMTGTKLKAPQMGHLIQAIDKLKEAMLKDVAKQLTGIQKK